MLENIGPDAADRVIESLRFGIPPTNVIREFTVGRDDQIRELQQTLEDPGSDSAGALLINANYGSGKSHLLKVLRHTAIDSGYAVSHVVVSAQNGVRFNRMDSILGEISRQIEVDYSGQRGVGTLFDAWTNTDPAKLSDESKRIKESLRLSEQWDYSDYMKSPGIQIALRAWAIRGSKVRDLIEEWLCNPTNYRGQRKLLYRELVGEVSDKFANVPPEWKFYADEELVFHTGGHKQAWDALSDFDVIAKAAGLRGIVFLFDEFEDVIQNLNRRDYQQQAYLNLFRFFAGELFGGKSYFAVTPDFVEKCKNELEKRGTYDFDFEQFDDLPSFQLDEITHAQFFELALKIRYVHGIAYDWNADDELSDLDLETLVVDLLAVPTPDRVRSAIQGVVEGLDDALDNA